MPTSTLASKDAVPSISSFSSEAPFPKENNNEHVLEEQPDGDDGEAENIEGDTVDANPSQKKKKKKKPKKSAAAKAKDAAAKKANAAAAEAERLPVLSISRNKHWRYISSYHGPWLQLPVELLESLLLLNLDPATLSAPDPSPQTLHSKISFTGNSTPTMRLREKDRGFERLRSETESLGGRFTPSNEHSMLSSTTNQLPLPPPLPLPQPGKAPPPPIDPGVFRNVTAIRRLIDEAAELSVRASSGLSAAELSSPGMMGGMGGFALSGSTWAAAQTLGINPLGGNGGRNVAMSAMRIHRLRALAVQKLAQAYKADEIASSVMVMQGGSVFDDVAEKVLKVDPNDADAKYVHFFHEKIPSRQLAESTTTQTLDALIAAYPHRLEFYRTRGVVHCFRDEYPQAIKDFTHALKEARAARKARMMAHDHADHGNGGGKSSMRRDKGTRGTGAGGKKKKGGRNASSRTNGQAPPNGTSAAAEDGDFEPGAGGGGDRAAGDSNGDSPPPPHPSALPDAPDPIEPQLLFLRGSAYLQQAVRMIELAVLGLEGLDAEGRPKEGTAKSKFKSSINAPPPPSLDTSELRLCYLQESLFGGVEIGNPAGPLGPTSAPKLKTYRKVLAAEEFRAQVISLIKKSIRDHEKFLGHFDTLEADLSHEKGKGGAGREDLKEQTECAFMLSESTRPGNYSAPTSGSTSPTCSHGHSDHHTHRHGQFPPSSAMFTTYHPLLVESHYAILLAILMLGDFARILPNFIRTAALVDGLEGYPVFLPPRSMAQAEFVEVLERLAGGWKKGHFEDEFALVRRVPGSAGGRSGISPGMPPFESPSTSRTTSSCSVGRSSSAGSGSSSPATTTTDLYDDVLISPQALEESNAGVDISVGEGGSSSGSGTASGSSSKTAVTGAGSAFLSSPSPAPRSSTDARPDAVEALDSLRILLAPVVTRQRERADAADVERERERASATKGKAKGAAGGLGGASSKKAMPINIPLHGPRVEVVLAWLGAVHLPELEV